MIKQMTDYKVVATKGGGVCLVGQVDNEIIQTTNIKNIRQNEVQTESGTIYSLSNRIIGMWSMQLQMKRPEVYEKLKKHNIV